MVLVLRVYMLTGLLHILHIFFFEQYFKQFLTNSCETMSLYVPIFRMTYAWLICLYCQNPFCLVIIAIEFSKKTSKSANPCGSSNFNYMIRKGVSQIILFLEQYCWFIKLYLTTFHAKLLNCTKSYICAIIALPIVFNSPII